MPYIITSYGSLPTFPVCVVLGFLLLLSLTSISLKKSANHISEENYIFPRLVSSGIVGYFTSALFDSLVKIPVHGEFRITGVTFYGGFIGAVITLFVLLNTGKNKTEYTVKQWFDLLTPPFIVFHAVGRIGCFLGGCCYGKVTDSCLGVIFPDNLPQQIIHNGVKRYPTQLFEVVALSIIFVLLLRNKNKFKNYVMLYAAARFFLEFFRGDERGIVSDIFSPSQIVAVVLLLVIIGSKCIDRYKNARKAFETGQ